MTRRMFVGALLGSAALFPRGWAVSAQESAAAAGSECENLNELLRPILEESGLPALAAGAVVRGRTVALGAVGVRKVGEDTPVSVEDKFHIGSCTKAMTATLAAMAVETGTLKWGSRLGAIFPERREKMNAAFQETTPWNCT